MEAEPHITDGDDFSWCCCYSNSDSEPGSGPAAYRPAACTQQAAQAADDLISVGDCDAPASVGSADRSELDNGGRPGGGAPWSWMFDAAPNRDPADSLSAPPAAACSALSLGLMQELWRAGPGFAERACCAPAAAARAGPAGGWAAEADDALDGLWAQQGAAEALEAWARRPSL